MWRFLSDFPVLPFHPTMNQRQAQALPEENPTAFKLNQAASQGDLDRINQVLQTMSQEDVVHLVNHVSPGGARPLHLAAYGGHFKTVELLLQLGAIPHAQDINGLTALDLAMKKNHTITAKILKTFKTYRDTLALSGPDSPPTPLKRQRCSSRALSKNTSNPTLNPFAEPFKPKGPISRLLNTHQNSDLPPISPTSSRRLNVFTGEWDDPFPPHSPTKSESNLKEE